MIIHSKWSSLVIAIGLMTYIPISSASAIGTVGTTNGGPGQHGTYSGGGIKGYSPSGRDAQRIPADGIQAPKEGDGNLYIPRSDVSGSSSSAPSSKTKTANSESGGTPYRGNFIQQTPTDFSKGNTTSPETAPGGVSEGTPYRGNYPRVPE